MGRGFVIRRVCPLCKTVFYPLNLSKKYCDNCAKGKVKARERVCEKCGKKFMAKNSKRIYCYKCKKYRGKNENKI